MLQRKAGRRRSQGRRHAHVFLLFCRRTVWRWAVLAGRTRSTDDDGGRKVGDHLIMVLLSRCPSAAGVKNHRVEVSLHPDRVVSAVSASLTGGSVWQCAVGPSRHRRATHADLRVHPAAGPLSRQCCKPSQSSACGSGRQSATAARAREGSGCRQRCTRAASSRI